MGAEGNKMARAALTSKAFQWVKSQEGIDIKGVGIFITSPEALAEYGLAANDKNEIAVSG